MSLFTLDSFISSVSKSSGNNLSGGVNSALSLNRQATYSPICLANTELSVIFVFILASYSLILNSSLLL